MREKMKKFLFWMLVSMAFVMITTGGVACGELTTDEPTSSDKSAIMVGDSCDCSLDGKDVVTDQGIGKCLDGVAVKPDVFTKYFCDPTFQYTKCTRDMSKCNDGGAGAGGTGGTGGSGGASGQGGSASVCLNASARACTTNQTQVCACTVGNGVQECNANCDAWTTCHDCSTGGAGGTGGSGGTAGAAGSDAGVSYCLDVAARACVTNQTQLCACPGGLQGLQLCNTDCSAWTTCECPDAGAGGAGGTGGSGGTAGAAGSDASVSYCLDANARACVTNQTNSCGCPGGVLGLQTCNADCSAWTPCECPDAGAGGAGGTGGSGGTAGGGGTAGAGGSTGYCLDANARACTTNQTNTCACAGGGTGLQTCNADCSGWTPCECPDAGAGGAGGTGGSGGTAGAAGTGGTIPICQDSTKRACTSGQVQNCACVGGATGTQSCNTDCTGWTACSCNQNLACHDGELCTGTGYSFTPCQVCTETVNGVVRNVRCQKNIMVSDAIQWDPACYPDAEAGTLANDCLALGVSGKIAVIIDVDPAFTPLAGQVLGVFGRSSVYSGPDAGQINNYTVWGQASLPTDKHLVVLPLNAVAGQEFQFEAGYAAPGNLDTSNWNFRCTASACPAADTYTVCYGTALLGQFKNGTYLTTDCTGKPGPWEWETGCIK